MKISMLVTVRVSLLLITLVLSPSTFGQSVLDNGSSAGLAPGVPAGSYSLSDIDNVNLFNGNLNLTVPLLKIGGRGEAGMVMNLPIESHWTNLYFFENPMGGFFNPIPQYNFPNGLEPGYGPGVLMLRGARLTVGPCGGGQFGDKYQTRTRLVFVASNGTEVELRDTVYDGAPLLPTSGCGVPTQSRGNTFVSADGSSTTFISDTSIDDQFTYSRNIFGYLMLRDGTRYRIDDGLVTWMRDRNGNKLEFNYSNDRVTLIKDSLNRQITIEYNVNDGPTYGLCDRITFKGFGGQSRIIRVSYASLSSVLAAGFSLQSKNQMFPQQTPDWVNGTPGMTSNFDTTVVSSVWLPAAGTTLRYRFLYNSYGELARTELPTGAAYEYDWEPSPFMSYDDAPQEILRRVKERRVFNGGTLERKTTYGYTLPPARTGDTTVVVDNLDGHAVPRRISQERHFFHGTPIPKPYRPIIDLYIDSAWTQGKEYQTEFVGSDGATVLRRITQTWRQRAPVTWWTCSGCTPNTAPIKDPRIVETITTLTDTNQVSKRTSIDPGDPSGQTVGFDQFNNSTDVWEYDFGVGAPGSFLRRSHTDYVVAANYVDAHVNPALGAHLRSLPSQQWISSDVAGATKLSSTVFEYDNYSNDTRHKPLVLRPGITNHDTAYSGSFIKRGNVTGATSYASAQSQTGPVTQSVQFDIAGNVVAMLDGLGNTSTTTFGDAFCNGSTCGGAFTANTYSFITSVTSPVPDPTGQHGSTTAFTTTYVYDFWSEHTTSTTNTNGQTTSFEYNDVFDRLTAVIRPVGGGRTDFEYGDTIGNLFVRTLNDLDTGRRTESYEYFDALGRVVESRTFESPGQYISIRQIPFTMLQDPDSGNWVAATETSNPYRLIEQPVWTTVFLDALSRSTKVRTPDNSILRTSYSGNSVVVTDQAGRVRKSVTDALGRQTEVYEDPQVPGGPIELNYQTTYQYDALDNLVKVSQGGQQRFFMYDSLKRLTRARNPEESTPASLNLSDPLTGNSVWSNAYQYDANSNLVQKTDGRGIVTSYTYDALNRSKTVDYSSTSSINPDVSRIYDGASGGKGRPWFTYAGGTENTPSDVEKTLFHSYDGLGRLEVLRQSFKRNGVWSSPYEIRRSYNLAGGIMSQVYPSNRSVTYNYDAAGRLADMDALNPAFLGNLGDGASPRTYSKGITYASGGQLAQEQFGTAASVYNKRFYNLRQQLAEILVSTTVGDTWDLGKIVNEYSLQCSGVNTGASCNTNDNNGNLRKQKVFVPNVNPQISPTSWHQQYDYDELNRLKRVHEYTENTALDWQQEFDYDRWGNRTINATATWIGNQNNPPSELVNEKQFDTNLLTSANRLQAPGDQPLPENQKRMSYDGAGNLINDTYTGAGERVYDAANRMIQAWGGDNQWQFYTYNADGQRTRRKINNQETWLVYGFDGELLAEYPAEGATNNPVKEYGYRNGQLLVTAEAGSGGGTQNVNWTNAIGVSISGNNLTRTMAGDGWSTGARSSQMIASGDGYAEFTVTETNKRRSFGLTSNTSVTSFQYISYGMHIGEDGQITIHEGGGVYGVFGTYTTGDKLRVSIEGGVVKYRKNGTLLRTSTLAPTYPLYAGASIYSNAGTVTAAVITSGLHSAIWTNVTGMSISNNNLTRTMSSDGWSTGAISSQSIASGDGYAEVTASETNKRRSFGLTSNTSVTSYQHISYGMCLVEDGSISIHEGSGVYGVFGTYTTGDKLRVSIEGGVVKYRKNGTLLRTSTLAPTYPLYAGASIYSNAGTVNNAVLTSGTIGSATQLRWLVADQLGTPRLILDETGSLSNIRRHDYLPFGEELFAGTGTRTAAMGYVADGVRQQFTSKERDVETGLDYFGARYHASKQGRFTSIDPLLSTGQPSNPQSWNRYSYTLNNPLRLVDPTGMFIIDPAITDQIIIDKIVNGYKKLQESLKKHKVGSKEHARIKRALDKLGGYGVKNGVVVTVGNVSNKDSSGNVVPTAITNAGKKNAKVNATITLNAPKFKDASVVEVADVLGHEATHAADFDVVARTWVIVRDQQGRVSADAFLQAFDAIRYNSEYNAFMLAGAVHQALEPNTPYELVGNTPIRARYQLPWTYGALTLWNPAWATLDAAKIETIRGMNVDSVLMTPKKQGGSYELQPPPKK